VVDLVLDAAGQQPLALDLNRAAAHVHRGRGDRHGPLAGIVEAGERQAALLAVLLALPAGDDRVDQHPEGVLAGLLVGGDVVGEHALEDPHLGRGQPGAVGVPEGLQQVVAEADQLGVEPGHRVRPLGQDRVAEQPDLEHCHVADSPLRWCA
jgi:hypothetical protein